MNAQCIWVVSLPSRLRCSAQRSHMLLDDINKYIKTNEKQKPHTSHLKYSAKSERELNIIFFSQSLSLGWGDTESYFWNSFSRLAYIECEFRSYRNRSLLWKWVQHSSSPSLALCECDTKQTNHINTLTYCECNRSWVSHDNTIFTDILYDCSVFVIDPGTSCRRTFWTNRSNCWNANMVE